MKTSDKKICTDRMLDMGYARLGSFFRVDMQDNSVTMLCRCKEINSNKGMIALLWQSPGCWHIKILHQVNLFIALN